MTSTTPIDGLALFVAVLLGYYGLWLYERRRNQHGNTIQTGPRQTEDPDAGHPDPAGCFDQHQTSVQTGPRYPEGPRSIWTDDQRQTALRSGLAQPPQRPKVDPYVWNNGLHYYEPDLQRDGRTCATCGMLPGGLWHLKP